MGKAKPTVNIDSTNASAKTTNAELKRQLKELEDKHLQLTEDNAVLKNQVCNILLVVSYRLV